MASSWGNPPPQVFGRGINPIVELGTNLRRNTPVTVLDYTTSLSDAPYLKVATLPDFTGKTWKPSEDFNQGRFEGALAIDDEIKVDPQGRRASRSDVCAATCCRCRTRPSASAVSTVATAWSATA